MNHKEFIDRLKEYGLNVIIESTKGTSEFYLVVNGKRLTSDEYGAFGYRCGGQYNPCDNFKTEGFSDEDLKNAIRTGVERIEKAFKELDKEINYFDVREYLLNHNGSKIDKSSIDRVLRLMTEDYQNLYYKRKRLKNEPTRI